MIFSTRQVLALALTVQFAFPVAALSATFRDISGHWAAPQIDALSDRSIIGGYPDGTFRPNGVITRAEFATVLIKALGLSASASASSSFRDVPASHWAHDAVETVRQQGLVSGYPGGYFLPNKTITRAEAMSLLVNAAHYTMPDTATVNRVLGQYADGSSVPTWARPAVAAALENGMFSNMGTMSRINPNLPATRGDVAAMTHFALMPNQDTHRAMPGPNNTGGTYGSYNPSGQVLRGRIATIPSETMFTATVTAPISSELNRVGDQVRLNLDSPLVSSDNTVVIPNRSEILGKITNITPTGRLGKNASMEIEFVSIVTPDGRQIPIEGYVATEDRMLDGGSTKGRILKALGKTAIGAGLGAALGTALGPLSGGSVGKGAIYGTAVGAGVGAVTAGVQKGNDVALTSGDQLEIKLQQPITVEVRP